MIPPSFLFGHPLPLDEIIDTSAPRRREVAAPAVEMPLTIRLNRSLVTALGALCLVTAYGGVLLLAG